MGIDYNLSKRGADTLTEIIEGIHNLVALCKKELPDIDSQISSLADLILCDFANVIEGNDLDRVKAENKSMVNYSLFLAESCVLAYLQKLDNDKNLNTLRDNMVKRVASKITDDEGVANEDELLSNATMDFKFGYNGLKDLVTDCAEVIASASLNEEGVSVCVESNLLANIRDIDVSTYLSEGYMEKDILLIAELGNKSKPELAEGIISFILGNEAYNKYYLDVADEVMGIYKYLLQDSFGLRPYIGVFSFKEPYLDVITDSYRLGTLKNARTVFENINTHLAKHYQVNESFKRQFDVKEIMFSSSSKPMYFPKKLLEYAMGRELTYELSENIYKEYSNNEGWDIYAEKYVEPQIKGIILEAIYYSLEHHFDIRKVGGTGSGSSFKFTSDDFKNIYVGDNKNVIHTYLSTDDMKNMVRNDITKLEKSLCTCVAVTRYNNLGNRVNSIGLRIVDTTNSLSTGLTKEFLSGLVINKKIEFADGDIISSGKLTSKTQPLPFDIYEYRHDFDEALSNAEPLFGYKAVEMFKKRNIPIGWSRILLGEDIKGTPIFASRTSLDDLPMQAKTVHNMMAGSRAGKGVMTMNILASAIAESKPVFYIDRKPDMAVLFYEISGGNMFVVNGGQYEGKNDPRGFFADTGTAISGWKTAYDSMPDYLKTLFPTKTYVGDFGDLVYFRAVMFTLGILMARVELQGYADKYAKLGGENGIIIIVDEFKNWQENFESTYFSCQGAFCNENRLSKSDKEGYRKALQDIKIKRAQMESLSDKPDRVMKLKLEIESKEEYINSIITPLKVYCTSLMDKYGQSKKHINSKLSAGFKDREGAFSDIFVIGQHIEIDGYDGSANKSGTYEERDSGLFNVNADTKGKSLLRGVFNNFQQDWFMGYNQDFSFSKNYMGANVEGSASNKWITKQMYWGYVRDADMSTLRNSAPADTKYFKPYLVLNKSNEDDPNNRQMITIGADSIPNPDFEFVAQCRNRVNDAVPGAYLWESVRLKHLQEGLREQVTENEKFYGMLNEGIGFVGLANQTKHANGLGDFEPSVDLGDSCTIANYVANCMGYSSYQELLFDFSPNGLFSTKDVVDAILNPVKYQGDIKKRIPLFYDFNLIGESSDSYEERELGNLSFNDKSYGTDEFSFIEHTDKDVEDEDENDIEVKDSDYSGTNNSDFMNRFSNDSYFEGWEDDDSEDEDLGYSDSELREVADYIIDASGLHFKDRLKAINLVIKMLRERGW